MAIIKPGSTFTDGKTVAALEGISLENYTEKLIVLSSGVINLSLGSVFTHTPSVSTSYTFTNALPGVAHSFTLIITQPASYKTISFQSGVYWSDGTVPSFTTGSKTYILTFLTINGGSTWFGLSGGKF